MPEIRLHNTLTGKVELLQPRDKGKVGIYACGPTVYAPIHIGNARPYVVFLLYKRFLEHQGLAVKLVVNITDINDKIYKAANEQGVSSLELAAQMSAKYIEDTDRLGLGRPDAEPLASEMIGQIVDLIAALIERGHAYEAGGDVYFGVRSFSDYGALSNRKLEDMESGEPGELKQDPLDFALWKGNKEEEDSSWESPWGRGRPGWHIECSAMAEELLGLDFDIHGGGSDLVFPHHENELAQTAAGRGRPLARIWMHNGMVRFGEDKMAKSVGNILKLDEALDRYGRDALIILFLGGHYRQPITFSESKMVAAAAQRNRIREISLLHEVFDQAEDVSWAEPYAEAFFDALAEDFSTPKAMADLYGLINECNRRKDGHKTIAGLEPILRRMLYCIGLENLIGRPPVDGIPQIALDLLQMREEARAKKDFELADSYREQIEAGGYVVRDTPEGATLVPKES